jgi:hypothetical protein
MLILSPTFPSFFSFVFFLFPWSYKDAATAAVGCWDDRLKLISGNGKKGEVSVCAFLTGKYAFLRYILMCGGGCDDYYSNHNFSFRLLCVFGYIYCDFYDYFHFLWERWGFTFFFFRLRKYKESIGRYMEQKPGKGLRWGGAHIGWLLIIESGLWTIIC